MGIDVPYSLELLKRINNLNIEGRPIHAFFKNGQYSDWAFQQFFLLSQIKEFSRSKDFSVYKKSRKPRFFFLSRIVMWSGSSAVLLASFVGYVYGLVLKPRVVLFCSDFLKPDSPINPRLFVVISYLHKRQVTFVEILHVTTMRNFFRNTLRRRRPAVYIESVGLVSYWICFLSGVRRTRNNLIKKISFDAIPVSERAFVESIVSETIGNVYRNRETSTLLGHFLQVSKVKKFISIDDVRYINEILLACEKSNIPSHIFQHSNFDYLVGLDTLPPEEYIFPNMFVAWNTYWSQKITEISPIFSLHRSKITIGGRPYAFTPPKQVVRSLSQEVDGVTVLIPYEVAVQRKQIQPYMDMLLNDARISILLVLRGDYERDLQVERYFGTSHYEHPRLSIVGPQDKEKAISKTDVVVGVYSGFLDEAIEMGLPVCVLDTEYVNINRLDRDGLAVLVETSNSDIFEKLVHAKNTSNKILEERKERVSQGTGSVEIYLESVFRA